MSERKYPIRNRVTGKRLSVTLRDYQDYMGVIENASGKPMFEALSDVPGVAFGYDGDVQQTLVPKERVHEAIGKDSNLRLLRSDDDPIWETARQRSIGRAKQQVAKERGGGAVLLDSLLSGVTFGQTSRLANTLAGEGAADARERGIQEYPGYQFGGRAASLLALGLLPIPGLGALTVGAAKGLRAGTIFELGGKSASLVRGAIKGEGFLSEVGRRIAAPVAFGLAADAPLSAAMVAADIVDHDKELTSNAIASEFFTQYGLSVGIAAATSIPFAFLGAGLKSVGSKALGKADSIFAEQDLMNSVGRGLGRHFFRPLRKHGKGVFDVAETHYHKVWSKIVKKHPGQRPSETTVGQWLAGGNVDDWVKLRMTNREAIDGLYTATTASQLRKNVDILRRNIRDPDLDAPLAFMRENADELITVRRKSQAMISESREFAKDFLSQNYKHPIGIMKDASEDASALIDKGLTLAGLKPLAKGMGGLPERLSKALNLRKELPIDVRNGQLFSTERAALDKQLIEAFPGLEKHLSWIDKAEYSAKEVIRMSDDFGVAGTRLFNEADLLDGTGFRAQLRGLDGPVRGLTDNNVRILSRDAFLKGERPPYVLKDDGMYSTIDTQFDDFADGLSAMAKANNTAQSLLDDAKPLISAQRPMTNEQILAAQVESVMSNKRRVAETLWYIARRGGGARHTAAFGGVYLFREMKVIEEKRAAFRMFHDSIRETATNMNSAAALVGNMVEPAASFDMGLGTAMAATQLTALSYLNQQLPFSSDSQILPEDLSGAEIDNFLEAVGALMDPVSVLTTAVDGSTMLQAVDAIRTVYPKLYVDMAIDVAEFVEEYGDTLGHAQLLGLDTFTGYALGYSDGPAPDLTMQPPYAQTVGQSRAIGGPENRRMDLQQDSTPAQKIGAM